MNFENIKQINFDALSDFCVSFGCLIDSSSIIYLDKVNLLEMFVERYYVKTIKSVFEEINSNLAKQFNDDISLQNIELINSNKNISEAEIDQKILTIFKNNNISKLSEVDKELLIYSIKLKLPIFTDDGGISLLCKENFLPYYNSLIADILLFYDNIIDEKKLIQTFFELNKIGRYSNKIYQFAFSLMEKVIKAKKI